MYLCEEMSADIKLDFLSTKTECDYLNGWIKKRSHTQKSHPKVVNPRDIAGEHKKTTQKKDFLYCKCSFILCLKS